MHRSERIIRNVIKTEGRRVKEEQHTIKILKTKNDFSKQMVEEKKTCLCVGNMVDSKKMCIHREYMEKYSRKYKGWMKNNRQERGI